METANQPSRLLGILTGAGRYVVGLLMLICPVAILLLRGKQLDYIILAALTPPINIVVLPPILIGLYFMLSSKPRIRIDFTLLLFYILLLFGVSTL